MAFDDLLGKARDTFAKVVNGLGKPSIEQLVDVAEGDYRAERAFSFVTLANKVIGQNARTGDKSEKIPEKVMRELQEIVDELSLTASGFNPIDQKGAGAMFQLIHRGEEGQKAFLDFCKRHKTYEAGLKVVEIALQNSGNLDTGYHTEGFKIFAQALIDGADKLKRPLVVDAERYRVLKETILSKISGNTREEPGLVAAHS